MKKPVSPIPPRIIAMLVEHLGVDETEITLDCTLGDDLGADSLDIIELAMKVEEEYGVVFNDDDEQLFDSGTLKDIIGAIERRGGTL